MQPIKMTKEEYQAKYGSAPIKMTAAEYQAKYGVAPKMPASGLAADFQARQKTVAGIDNSNISLPSKILQNAGQIFGGVSDIVGEGAKALGIDKIISMIPTMSGEGKLSTLGAELPKSVASLKKQASQIQTFQDISKKFEDFSTKHPEAVGDMGAIMQTIGGLLNATGVGDIVAGGTELAGSTLGKDAAKEAVEDSSVSSFGKVQDSLASSEKESVKEVGGGAPAEENKMPVKEPTKLVQTETINPFKKVQQAVTAIPSVVKGGIKTIANTLSKITDPALYDEAATKIKDGFTKIMQSAKDSLSDADSVKPHEVVGTEAVQPAVEDFNKQWKSIGSKIGDYKTQIGDKVVTGLDDVYSKFKSDMESTFHKVFQPSGTALEGKVTKEEMTKFLDSGEGATSGKATLTDTGTVATKLGSAEKQIVDTFNDFEKAVKGGTVNDLEAMKSNMQNIIAKVTEDSPALTKNMGRIFTTAYKGMNEAINSVAKESGIEDWTKTAEDYGKFNDAKRVIEGTTDAQGKIDYAQIAKNSLKPEWKSTIDFLQSKTGIPIRAYTEFANWSEKAFSDSKVTDIIKMIGGKTVGLPMMGLGRSMINLIGDVPGKTFAEIDDALSGGASKLESAISDSSALTSTLKKMGMTARQGAMMLLSNLENGGAKGAAKITAGQEVNDSTK
jgi:hypothetical protein